MPTGTRAPTAFEYWAHAACILPLDQWPTYAIRRRAFRARGLRWHEVPEHACADVLARLRAEGPLTATQLGGAKSGGEWWDWSDVKIAVEWLLDIGDVVCVRRTGWRRVYDLPERVIPAEYLGVEPSDDECLARMAGVAARALGVVTQADLTDFHRLQSLTGRASKAVDVIAARAAGLIPVIAGGQRARAPPAGPIRPRSRRSRGAGTARRCCRPSTRWSGTASEPSGCSASPTAWRRTCPRPSACTGTSPCRC